MHSGYNACNVVLSLLRNFLELVSDKPYAMNSEKKVKKKKLIFQQNPQADVLLGHVIQNPDYINTCKKGYKSPISKYSSFVAQFAF